MSPTSPQLMPNVLLKVGSKLQLEGEARQVTAKQGRLWLRDQVVYIMLKPDEILEGSSESYQIMRTITDRWSAAMQSRGQGCYAYVRLWCLISVNHDLVVRLIISSCFQHALEE